MVAGGSGAKGMCDDSFCILSLSLGVFGRQRPLCVNNVLHSVSFREYPFADLSRFVVVALVIIMTQSWGSRNCFTRTKIRRKCSSARALTETITVSL